MSNDNADPRGPDNDGLRPWNRAPSRLATNLRPLIHSAKDAQNPPIVTIIGAGICGLTAAHELTERGFLVQVVEQQEDPRRPGRCQVGGMARTQWAAIRARIEDVHPDLLDGIEKQKVPEQEAVEDFLRLCAHARGPFVQTLEPLRLGYRLLDDGTFGSEHQATGEPHRVHVEASSRDDFIPREAYSISTKNKLDELARILNRASEERMKRWFGDICRTLPEGIEHDLEPKLASVTREVASTLGGVDIKVLMGSGDETITDLFGLEKGETAQRIRSGIQRESLLVDVQPFVTEPGERNQAAALRDRILRWFEQHHGHLSPHLRPREPRRVARTSELQVDITYWVELKTVELWVPGEHGFRFFPSYYQHIDDTMKRTPLLDDLGKETGRSVLDNLIPTTRQILGMRVKRDTDKTCREPDHGAHAGCKAKMVELDRAPATSIEGVLDRTLRFITELGATPRDALVLQAFFLKFLTSCPERRTGEYESISWARFIDLSERFSEPMRDQIRAAAQALIAFSVEDADAHTYGNSAVQLWLDQFAPGGNIDRTLNGPSSDAWLEPWRRYLEHQGVRFFCGCLDRLEPDQSGGLRPVFIPRLPGAHEEHRRSQPSPDALLDAWRSDTGEPMLRHGKGGPGAQPDFYVLALPLEPSAEILSRTGDTGFEPGFERLESFARAMKDEGLRDMVGLQYFFEGKAKIGDGHAYYPDSPWSLSSITQSEFWVHRSSVEEGYQGVLSVDVCTADQPSHRRSDRDVDGRAARSVTSPTTLALEVWRQILERTSSPSEIRPPRPRARSKRETGELTLPAFFHLDSGVTLAAENGKSWTNATRFLASRPGAFRTRPGLDESGEIEYCVEHGRWVLAGTHMATYTRMTTMEAANESGRQAVCAILECLERHAKDRDSEIRYNGATALRRRQPPPIFDPRDREPRDLANLKDLDKRLYDAYGPGSHFFDILRIIDRLDVAVRAYEIEMESSLERTAWALETLIGDTERAASLDFKKIKDLYWSTIDDAMGKAMVPDSMRKLVQQYYTALESLLKRLTPPAIRVPDAPLEAPPDAPP